MQNILLVSVVMPVYNKRPYVKRAINSVREQTFTDWELIIVDDGSTDDSMAEIPRDDKRIRLFQQSNAGPGTARNNGIRKARGEFVTFLDAYNYSKALVFCTQMMHDNFTKSLGKYTKATSVSGWNNERLFLT